MEQSFIFGVAEKRGFVKELSLLVNLIWKEIVSSRNSNQC